MLLLLTSMINKGPSVFWIFWIHFSFMILLSLIRLSTYVSNTWNSCLTWTKPLKHNNWQIRGGQIILTYYYWNPKNFSPSRITGHNCVNEQNSSISYPGLLWGDFRFRICTIIFICHLENLRQWVWKSKIFQKLFNFRLHK